MPEVQAKKEFKNQVSQIYLEKARDDKNLALTKSFLALWAGCLEAGRYADQMDELEQRIRERAEMEWGQNTRVNFDRETRTAVVTNAPRNLSCKWKET